MAQVFISYAHTEPDQTFAHGLASFLERNRLSVFVDSKIRLGQSWVEQIDSQLRATAQFVVLLSAKSLESDMVRREIALAYRLKKEGQLKIFPVRIGLTGDLPYDIGAYLDLIQYVSWQPDQATQHVFQTILEALSAAHCADAPAPVLRPVHFEESQLARLRDELTRYLGPIAPMILDRAARKAATWNDLYETIALEIRAGDERKSFLARRR